MRPNLNNIKIVKLKKIPSSKGSVLHCLKNNEKNFVKFGEVYISTIFKNKIKAWKLHNKMFLNLIVPIGEVAFVFYNQKTNKFKFETIGENNYCRIFVPPKIWYGFKGINSKNFIINIASIKHNDSEQLNKKISEINFDWQKI